MLAARLFVCLSFTLFPMLILSRFNIAVSLKKGEGGGGGGGDGTGFFQV